MYKHAFSLLAWQGYGDASARLISRRHFPLHNISYHQLFTQIVILTYFCAHSARNFEFTFRRHDLKSSGTFRRNNYPTSHPHPLCLRVVLNTASELDHARKSEG